MKLDELAIGFADLLPPSLERDRYLTFNREAAPIASLFNRMIRRPFVSNCRKIVVDTKEDAGWIHAANIFNALNVTVIPWQIVLADYFACERQHRKQHVAEALANALSWASKFEGWPAVEFQSALIKCREANFVNEWYLWRAKSFQSPNRSMKARVFCRYDETGIDVELELSIKKEKTSETLRMPITKIASGMYGLACAAKTLRWVNSKRIRLVALTSSESIDISLK